MTYFRADIVGSFLRPTILKEARLNFEKNKISKEDLREIENIEITRLVKKLEELELKVVTDGEFRRSWWHLDFFWGINGVEKSQTKVARKFGNEFVRNDIAILTGKISGENHPFVEDFKFINSIVSKGTTAKQTIPSPAQFLGNFYRPSSYSQNENHIAEYLKYYDNEDEFLNAIGNSYRTVIDDLYNAGCRYIQFDDTNWAYLSDSSNWANVENKDEFFNTFVEKCVYVNNLAIENIPEDLTIGTHICRGNFRSNFLYKGDYSTIAEPLFVKENIDNYYLEFDSERAGSFESLKDVPKNKYIVLGLITSKTPELEDKEFIISRIKDASNYVDLDKLCLSPQCGFASTEEGNTLTEEEQWNKIKLVIDIANEVWG